MDYKVFAEEVLSYAKSAIANAEQTDLAGLGLRVKLDVDYNFSRKQWLAVYERSSGEIKQGIIKIGLNIPLIYKEMNKRGIGDNEFNIAAQSIISVMHEVGHGIVDYIRVKGLDDEIGYMGYTKEEKLVEEYGQSFFSEATGVYSSQLSDILLKIKKQKLNEQLMILVTEITNAEIKKAAAKADKHPSDAQKEAGNYKVGHIKLAGFDISIENAKGSKRYWKDENGREGFNVMKNHYGYFKRTDGYDGDPIDVFIGDYLDFDKIYVVDQNKTDGSFDESKVMLGFKSKEEAKKAYLSNYEKGWKGLRSITEVSIEGFKEWLYDGKKQRKPFADYKGVNENTIRITEVQLNEMIFETIVNILQ